MFSYSPPSHVDDLAGRATRDHFHHSWHTHMLKWFREEVKKLGPGGLFFTEVDTAATSAATPITWNAFPLTITRDEGGGPAAWKKADVLLQGSHVFRNQDEYCEWFAYKDSAGKLRRIVFTAESPEYWVLLGLSDLDRVVDLYQTHVDPRVKKSDLQLTAPLVLRDDLRLKIGDYNPYNIWNTIQGVMHLTHPANTIGAEINLAAVATAPRKDGAGKRVGDVRRLVCCASFGDPNRSSDPTIGWGVNTTCLPLAAGGAVTDATLADPVALYIKGLQPGTITGPQDEPLDDWFKVVRGGPGMGLMAVLEAPPGATFGLDSVRVNGVPLEYGGQVAEAIDMVLYAKGKPHNGPAPTLRGCDHGCCMPAGTAASKIPSINLDQVRVGDSCGADGVPAYPELASQHVLEAAPADLTQLLMTRRARHVAE